MHLKLLPTAPQAWRQQVQIMFELTKGYMGTNAVPSFAYLQNSAAAVAARDTVFHSRPNEAAADFHICSVIIQL